MSRRGPLAALLAISMAACAAPAPTFRTTPADRSSTPMPVVEAEVRDEPSAVETDHERDEAVAVTDRVRVSVHDAPNP